MWATWGPPGSWRPQVGPTLAPWILLSGRIAGTTYITYFVLTHRPLAGWVSSAFPRPLTWLSIPMCARTSPTLSYLYSVRYITALMHARDSRQLIIWIRIIIQVNVFFCSDRNHAEEWLQFAIWNMTKHFLGQCWKSVMTPYGITKT